MSKAIKLDQEQLKYGSFIHERMIRNKIEESIDIESSQIKTWINSGKFSEEMFSNRLKELNLTLNNFVSIFNAKEFYLDNSAMHWINILLNVLKEQTTSAEYGEFSKALPFNSFVIPFLAYGDKLLLKEVNIINSELIEWFSIRKSILSALARELSELSLKVLIKEIHISKKLGELKGEDKYSRYKYFNEIMLKDNDFVIDILLAYPVLTRLLIEKTENLVASYIEALSRYINDFSSIKIDFHIDGLILKNIEGNNGDSHKNGRSVMLFEYENGEKLVYKPRSMSVDEHFNDLLEWINFKETTFEFKGPKTKNYNTYGWQEFIKHKPCENVKEVEQFYYRQGGYLALLYLLRSKDFHYENLIANGAHPILIDLETLFDNVINFQNIDTKFGDGVSDYTESILGSAMLPFNFVKRKGMDLDFSALGVLEEGELAEFSKNYTIANENTDEIRLKEIPVKAEKKENLPVLSNISVGSYEYIDVIEEGFQTLYTFFLRNKEELASKQGPIYKFENDEIRHVFRNTNLYVNFLVCGKHPEYLQDGLNRNKLFDILWGDVKNESKYIKFVNSECNDLLNQDVPYFTFKFNSKDLINSKGNIIKDFYDKSSLELVLERCMKLSLNDCRRQSRYIRMSLSTLNKDRGEAVIKPNPEKIAGVKSQDFLEESLNIGEEISNHLRPLSSEREINRFALSMGKNIEGNGITLGPLDEGIYDGFSGLAVFFGQLASETNDKSLKILSEDIFDYAYKTAKFNHKRLKNPSAFTGIGSILYTAAYFHLLWDDPKYYDVVVENLNLLEELNQTNKVHDYLTGEAGVILVCLRIYEKFSNEQALSIAIKLGEYIVEELSVPGEIDKLLTGFSHGASGYAWPLMSLGHITKDEKFIKLANKLIRYENNLFDKQYQNWLDLRPQVKNRTGSYYWCHGAPGIALARHNILQLNMNPQEQREQLTEDLRIAIKATLKNGFKFNHCLCHGDLGNIDILLTIAKEQNNIQLLTEVLSIGFGVLEQGKKLKWMNGIDKKSEMYGFMLGLSGIGFELLRLWNNDIPSILNLELPS
ncbi:type 2 lanthipeptide synthetase LanM family protein [Bacillus cereus]|uniref:type 2 lanthipeptide synthetase LanM family protein n=1 Tax=Bacillus cereus TaxID=1396 RepID=UPI0011AA1E2F|nr:type 2 lanthipeptide synthetase LanM family protein [Bacillus cereus]MDA2649940.1 type 2 lanthipeptide synthetase LanM family protein [Bacillus cereus]